LQLAALSRGGASPPNCTSGTQTDPVGSAVYRVIEVAHINAPGVSLPAAPLYPAVTETRRVLK
jgi:hypothetical protein